VDKNINGTTGLEKTLGIVQTRVSISILIITQMKGYLLVIIAFSSIDIQFRKKE
jgi:hypothetical protein